MAAFMLAHPWLTFGLMFLTVCAITAVWVAFDFWRWCRAHPTKEPETE